MCTITEKLYYTSECNLRWWWWLWWLCVDQLVEQRRHLLSFPALRRGKEACACSARHAYRAHLPPPSHSPSTPLSCSFFLFAARIPRSIFTAPTSCLYLRLVATLRFAPPCCSLAAFGSASTPPPNHVVGQNSPILLDIVCALPLRRQCPAVSARCGSSRLNFMLIRAILMHLHPFCNSGSGC